MPSISSPSTSFQNALASASVPDELHVPHLLLHERAFVLRPLADVAPDLRHPTLYQTVREMLAEVEDDHAVEAADYPAEWLQG